MYRSGSVDLVDGAEQIVDSSLICHTFWYDEDLNRIHTGKLDHYSSKEYTVLFDPLEAAIYIHIVDFCDFSELFQQSCKK